MLYFINILMFLSVFCATFGYAVFKYTSSPKERCWHQRLQQPAAILLWRKAFPIGFIAMGIFMVCYFVALADVDFWEHNILTDMLYLFGSLLIPIPLGMIFGEKWVLGFIQTQKYAINLREFAPINEIEQFVQQANEIEIFGDGIALYDSVGYTFKTFAFNDYSLGNFTNGKQLIMVATYFLQAYPNKYKIKIIETLAQHNATGNNVANLGGSATAIFTNASGSNFHSIKLIKK